MLASKLAWLWIKFWEAAQAFRGDFSVNVDLGFWIEHGEVIGRVKDTMVAGSVYTALKNLVELGGDAEWNGSCYTPSVIVEGLSVTGRS